VQEDGANDLETSGLFLDFLRSDVFFAARREGAAVSKRRKAICLLLGKDLPRRLITSTRGRGPKTCCE
jgi:hypothetical protein